MSGDNPMTGPRIGVTGAWEQHGQSILAAVVLGLLGWNANTTYSTKIEVTAMRAQIEAELRGQRESLLKIQTDSASASAVLQNHETRITVMEREDAVRAVREVRDPQQEQRR